MSQWSSWTPETGLVVRTPKPSIVVWCRHGIDGGKAAFVQRYRYDVSMGRWNPTSYTAEGGTYTPNVEGDAPWSNVPPMFLDEEDGDLVGRIREHFTARCKLCPRLVAMQADRAQAALALLADAGLTDIPLAALQRAYDEAPKRRRL
jgi:hypothetical protein